MSSRYEVNFNKYCIYFKRFIKINNPVQFKWKGKKNLLIFILINYN